MKLGDRVSLSVAVSVELAQYKYLKPHYSITREFPGGDEAAFMAELEADVRRGLARAVCLELDFENDLCTALQADGLEALKAFCQKEIGHVAKSAVVSVERSKASGPDASAQEQPRPGPATPKLKPRSRQTAPY